MNVRELAEKINLNVLTGEVGLTNEIKDVYICDLLSWVMANASENCAWVTIQGHINIVAVAALLGIGCIVVSEGSKVESDTIKKAMEEEIPILSTNLAAYELAKKFAELGI